MAEIVGGLFGVTPESLQMQRQALLDKQAMDYASLDDPYKQANYAIYRGVGGLTREVGGLLGAQDPEMMRIQQRQSMLQGLDLNNPESLKQGIQTAMQNKDYQLVSELTKRYQDTAKAALEGRKTEAEIAAKLREGQTNEMKNAQSAADMSGAPRGSEEWNKAFNSKFNELLAKNPSIDNIGVAAGSRMPVYFDKNTNQQFTIQDGKRVAYTGGVDRSTATTKVDMGIGGILEKFGAQADAKVKSEAWAKAGDLYKTQNALIPKLDSVENALPNTFTGSFANAATQFGKALSGFGIPIDTKKISNTEYLNSVTAQLVRTIARDFPGSQSNAELQQLLASKPSAPQEWDTILRLLKDVKKEVQSSTLTYERMSRMPEADRYKSDFNYEQGQTFNKLNRYRQLESSAKSLKPGQTMSRQEVEEAKNLKKELGI